jgi:hypothetical protein
MSSQFINNGDPPPPGETIPPQNGSSVEYVFLIDETRLTREGQETVSLD